MHNYTLIRVQISAKEQHSFLKTVGVVIRPPAILITEFFS